MYYGHCVVDRRSDRALYHQLADELRERIVSGRLAPGSRLPSESELARVAGVGRDAVRQALAELRGEGLVVTTRGQRSRVREMLQMTVTRVPVDAAVRARMPGPEERRRLNLPDGVPVLVVRVGGRETSYPADRIELRCCPDKTRLRGNQDEPTDRPLPRTAR